MFVSGGLVACSDRGNSPWASTFSAALPVKPNTTKQAQAIPYASIDMAVAGRGGLLILAEQTQGLTFWQSSQRETIVLRDGYVNATRGLQRNLLSSRIDGAPNADSGRSVFQQRIAQPINYDVVRSWERSDGSVRTGRARATLSCGGTEHVELPLTALDLERCTEELEWSDGAITRSVFWREPVSRRIWAADAVAWPGGIQLTWQVARPWWQ